MEKKRNCGWIAGDRASQEPVVWARGGVAVTSCPQSHITAESISLLEEFHAWKLFGARDYFQMAARLVEAIFVLENELRSEKNDA